jgi:hypothetical protein
VDDELSEEGVPLSKRATGELRGRSNRRLGPGRLPWRKGPNTPPQFPGSSQGRLSISNSPPSSPGAREACGSGYATLRVPRSKRNAGRGGARNARGGGPRSVHLCGTALRLGPSCWGLEPGSPRPKHPLLDNCQKNGPTSQPERNSWHEEEGPIAHNALLREPRGWTLAAVTPIVVPVHQAASAMPVIGGGACGCSARGGEGSQLTDSLVEGAGELSIRLVGGTSAIG